MEANGLIFKCNCKARLKSTTDTAVRHHHAQTLAQHERQHLLLFAAPIEFPISQKSLHLMHDFRGVHDERMPTVNE